MYFLIYNKIDFFLYRIKENKKIMKHTITDNTITDNTMIKDIPRTKLCLFAISSIMNAEQIGLSLQSHQDDAREFLTAITKLQTSFTKVRNTFANSLPSDYNLNDTKEQFSTMLIENNEYVTSKNEFQQIYTLYKNIDLDPQWSIIKKLVELYEFEHLMNKKTIHIITGILEDYLQDNL